MAWSSNKTWTTGELVTAADLNIYIRDQLDAISHYPIEVLIDGGGAVISSGSVMDFIVPFDGTVGQWDVMSDVASRIDLEIWAVSFAGAPPVSQDSINSGSYITSACARYNQDTNPSAFGALTKGEVAQVQVIGACGVTKSTVSMFLDRT